MKIEILAPLEQPTTQPITSSMSETEGRVEYVFRMRGATFRLSIETGYLFDGASIPRLCWTLLGLTPHGAMDGPAIPHDKGYQDQGKFEQGMFQVLVGDSWADTDRGMTRNELDNLLQALCLHFKVCGRFKASLVYSAVRCCGWRAWKRNDKQRKAMQVLSDAVEAMEVDE